MGVTPVVAEAANKNDGEWEVGRQIGEFGSIGLIHVLKLSHTFMSGV